MDYSHLITTEPGKRAAQMFAASMLTSTVKYAASLRIICRLKGFLPAKTSEIVDLAIDVSRLSCAWYVLCFEQKPQHVGV